MPSTRGKQQSVSECHNTLELSKCILNEKGNLNEFNEAGTIRPTLFWALREKEKEIKDMRKNAGTKTGQRTPGK